MKKLFMAILILPAVLSAGPVFDKEKKIWTFHTDDPEEISNAIRNEKLLERRIAMLESARQQALSRTNLLTVISSPSTVSQMLSKPRTFSKMKCVMVLTEMGIWPQVKSWIEGNELYDIYLAAQNFSESDPYFKRGLETLKGQFGLTDSQIQTILKNCEAD